MNKISQIIILALLLLSACAQEIPGPQTRTQTSTPRSDPQQFDKLRAFKERQVRLFDKLRTLPMYEAIRSEVIEAPGASMQIFEPLSDAMARDDVAEVNNVLNKAPYLVNRDIIYPGKSASGRILPLIYAVRENKKALFDALAGREATDPNVSDKESMPLGEAFLLTKKDQTAGKYFLQELLANGASPLVRVENGQLLAEQPEFKAGGALSDIGDRMKDMTDANFLKEEWKVGTKTFDFKPRLIKAAETCDLVQMTALTNNRLSIKSFKLIDQTIYAAGSQKNCNKQDDMLKLLMTKAPYPRKWQLVFVSSWPHTFQLSTSNSLVDEEFAYRNIDSTVMELAFETELYDKISMPGSMLSEQMHKFLNGAWKSLSGSNDSSLLYSPVLTSFLANKSSIESIQKVMDFTRKIMASREPNRIAQDIFDFSQTYPVVIAAGWERHGFSLVIFKNLVIKLNKGDRSPSIISGARIYSFVNSPNNLKKLLPLIVYKDSKTLRAAEGKRLFDQDIDAQMDLVLKKQIEEPEQCIGNCTWESDASYGLQFMMTIFLTPDWQNKNTDELIATLAYEQGKIITEEFKKYAVYHLVDKYLVHIEKSLGQSRCVPETHMLALIIGRELSRAASSFGDQRLSFYGKKIIHRILESGWHLPGLRKELDPENKNNHQKLLLLLNHLGIGIQTVDDNAKAAAEALLEIFDPQKPKVGLVRYAPGRCY